MRPVRSALIVVALTAGLSACSSVDVETPPLSDGELVTVADMPSVGWTVDNAGPWEWEDSGSSEPYSLHICGGEPPSLKWFPEFADLEHADRVFKMGVRGSVAEVVFAGTSDELAGVHESAIRRLGECLAVPDDLTLIDDSFDLTASPLPSFGLGLGDFRLRQQLGGLSCDHRMALVLTENRLVVVELSGFTDQFTDADFETLVESAVQRTRG